MKHRHDSLRHSLGWLTGTLILCLACGQSDPETPTGVGDPNFKISEGGVAETPEPEAARDIAPFIADTPHEVAILTISGMGEIRFELLPELAPRHVAKFKWVVERDAYSGTTFHRVIPGFMIQGGDPNTRDGDPRNDGRGGSGKRLAPEFSEAPHLRGIVSMARKGKIDSATSQFFIIHEDSPQLDGKYSIFGRVISGMEVVDAITELPRDQYGRYGPPNRPFPDSAVIEKVEVETPAGFVVPAPAATKGSAKPSATGK